MSGTVFLRHPDLPADQWIEVEPESRVHHSGAGWQLVPDEDVAARAAARAHELARTQALMAGLPEPPSPPAVPDTDGGDGAQADGAPGGDHADPLPEPATAEAEADADAATPAAPAAPKKRSR